MYRRELLVATDILHIYLLGKQNVNLTYTISHIESEWWGWKPVQLLQLPLEVLSGNKIESINYDWNTSHAPGLAPFKYFLESSLNHNTKVFKTLAESLGDTQNNDTY